MNGSPTRWCQRPIAFGFVLCIAVLMLGPGQAAPDKDESIEFVVDKVDGKEMVLMKFADITLAGNELKFIHSDGASTDVSVVEHKVQFKTARGKAVGKSIKTSLYNGKLGAKGK